MATDADDDADDDDDNHDDDVLMMSRGCICGDSEWERS